MTMFRLLRIVIVNVGVLALLLTGSVIAARVQPELPPLWGGLQYCADRPCYYGIVPGQTAWDDAAAILQNVPGLTLDAMTELSKNYHGPHGDLRLDRNAPGGPVSHIALTPLPENRIDVGWLIRQFGTPCGILPNITLGRMQLFYGGLGVIVEPSRSAHGRRINPTSTVLLVSLFNAAQKPPCSVVDRNVQPWRGFRLY
jgi:hypothetical protein